jgi:titin
MPNAPSIPNSAITPTGVTASWAAITSATATGNCSLSGYLLEVASGSTWVSLTSLTYTSLSYVHTGFSTGTSYTYRLIAINAVGNSTPSSNTTITTDRAPTAAPTTPTCNLANVLP